MQELTEVATQPAPTYIHAQNAIVGLHGRDLFSTVRTLVSQSIRHPLHNVRHGLRLGRQLGRILLLGATPHQVNSDDPRFMDPTWQRNPLYRRGLQSYLASQAQLLEWVEQSALSADDRARARFLCLQLSNALAPSNTLLNPLAIKECFDTGGQSMLRGATQLLNDLRHNQLLPRQVDPTAFRLGENLATTPGAVVYRNELLELIQYRPQTAEQHAVPVMIVPPQINKFYIFDLSPQKSFVQYCLANGLQVFMVSWRNPDSRHREWGLSSYVQALRQAFDACRAIGGAGQVSLLGACAGGLTSAALQGHLQARRKLQHVASASYLVSLLDSRIESQPLLFLDEETLEAAKRRSYQRGVLDGREMTRIFSWMRPNELIWTYWINNYLLGRLPPAFDILHWNNDNTRLPAALHGELIDLFKHNPLARPGALEICGTPLDLSKVDVDSFSVGGITDHITPWEAVYRSALLLGGKRRFVLANSGHVQSIINPPDSNLKAHFQESDCEESDPRTWFAQAEQRPGSWWPEWLSWIQARSGPLQAARTVLGSERYPELDAAPGRYVVDE